MVVLPFNLSVGFVEANLDKSRSGANGIVNHDPAKQSSEWSSQRSNLCSFFLFFLELLIFKSTDQEKLKQGP